MIYNPELHTKDYLLKNPGVAVELAKISMSFINGIAQDESYLIAAHKGATSESNPLLTLAQSQHWANTPAAQNKKILSLRFHAGLAVAHFLTECAGWASSPAGQDKDVLMLAGDGNYSVAHDLAFKEAWGRTPAAQDLDILIGLRTKDDGSLVAHHLAKHNPEWLLTPIASSREVLSAKPTDDSHTIIDLALSTDHEPEQKAEFLLRPLKFGDAVFIKNADNLSAEIVLKFTEIAVEYISQAPNLTMHGQLVAALYSTLVNLRSVEPILKSQADRIVLSHALNGAISGIEPMLIGLLDKNTDFSNLLSGHGQHCDPARNVILKCLNKEVFADVLAEHEISGSSGPSTPGLY